MLKTINTILTLLLFGIAMFGIFKAFNASTDADTPLREAISSGAYIVDVRTPEEFATGSADGAVNIPLDDVENHIEDFRNKNNVIVFCKSGNRSAQAKKILEEHGIQSVFNGGTWRNMQKLVAENFEETEPSLE